MRVFLETAQRQHLPDMLSPIETTAEALYSFFSEPEDSIRPSTQHANTLLRHTLVNTLTTMVALQASRSDEYPTLRKFFKKLVFSEIAEHNKMMMLCIDVDYADIQRLYQDCKNTLSLDEIDTECEDFQNITEIDVLCEALDNDPDIAWLAGDDISKILFTRDRPSRGTFWTGAVIEIPNDVEEHRKVTVFLEKYYIHRVLSSKDKHRTLVNLPDENYNVIKELVTKRVCKTSPPMETLSNFDHGFDLSLALAYGQEARSILTFLSGHPEIAYGIVMYWDDMLMAKQRQLPQTSAQGILEAFDDPGARKTLGGDVCDAFDGNSNDIRFNIKVAFSPVLNNYLKLSHIKYDFVIDNPLNLDVLKKLKGTLLK